MITDSQFEACRLAANESYKRHKGSVRGQIITPEDDWEWHFARELIALAQQVKPLEWRSSHAYTVFGTYYVSFRVTTETYSVWRNGDPIVDESFDTEAEAIEAANEDYQRRVLSCLAWGWV